MEPRVLFYTHGVRNSQFMTATGTARRNNFATGFGTHSGPESMFIHFLPT